MEIIDVSVLFAEANVYYIPFEDTGVLFYHTFQQDANVTFHNSSSVFTVDTASSIIFLKVNPTSDITTSVLTNGLVLSTDPAVSNIDYVFTNASTQDMVTIYSNKDLLNHYYPDDTINTGVPVRDEPLHRVSKISFDFKDDFPMSARDVDFTVFIEYTCQGNVAEVDLFRESNERYEIPDSRSNRALFINKFYAAQHKLVSYTKHFSDNYELSANVHDETETTELHLCGCGAHDFIHITAERNEDGQFFILHNISMVQGIVLDDASYMNNGTVNNIFMGTDSGYSNSGGVNNVFIGNNSGKENVGGTDNVFLGYKCGEQNQGGNNNVFIGTECGVDNSVGYNNVFIGYKCGFTNTVGYNNIFIGYECGFRNTTGHDNVFIGQRAGYFNVTGSYNMIIGAETKGNVEDVNEDYYNTIRMIKKSVDGFIAETKLAIDRLGDIEGDTSDNNSVIGVKAAEAYVEGTGVGSNNVFCGSFNATNLTQGSNNTLLGAMITPLAASLSSNTLVGALCAANVDDSFGQNNTAIGVMCSLNQTNCHNNVAIGELSAANQSDSNNNVSIGQKASFRMTDGHNNVIIGTNAAHNARFDHSVEILHFYEEPEIYLANVDASNAQFTFETEINLVDKSLLLFLNEPPPEGNVYAYLPPDPQWMNESHFVTVQDTNDVFSNVHNFSSLQVGDSVELHESSVGALTYVLSFLHNDFNDEYLYSSVCLGTTLDSFNMVFDKTELSGFVVVSNDILTQKVFIEEKNIHFISTYIS